MEEKKIEIKFTTGTVPYKIEKPFYDKSDCYTAVKKTLDEMIQAKNKQTLQNEGVDSKNSLDLEAEIQEKLKITEKDFENYMRGYLKKYKEDPEDYNEVNFTPKKTPPALVEIIENLCKEFGIKTDVRGKGKKRTISIYKSSNPAPRKEKIMEEKEKKQIIEEKKDILQDEKEEKIKIIEKNASNELKTQNIELKNENDTKEFKFPPDPIEDFQVKLLMEDQILLEFKSPDDNGDKIIEYLFYGPQKNLIKKSDKNEFALSFSEDFPKCAINLYPHGFFLTFSLTSKNSIGESKIARSFHLLINPFNKYNFLISGQQIPLDDDKIGDLSQFTVFFQNRFKNLLNKLCLNNVSLMVLDGGLLVQWGYSIDSTEFEVNPTKNPELLDEMISTPFYPLKNNVLIHAVSCGVDFCAALSIKGEIFTWGLNNYGQLGHGDGNARIFGTKIQALSKEFCIGIASGISHCLALNEKGEIYAWGFKQAEEGQPVLDRFNSIIDYENFSNHQPTPRLIKYIQEKIINIYCGGYHNMALSEKGVVYSWGDNEKGQLGMGYNKEIRPILNSVIPKPIEVFKGKDIIKLSCGESHNIAIVREKITEEEEIWSWGNSNHGQCGLGDFINRDIPTRLIKVWKEETASVSCGTTHSLFLTKKGEVFGCGLRSGAFGENGDVEKKNIDKRVCVPILLDIGAKNIEICEVVAGNETSAVLFK